MKSAAVGFSPDICHFICLQISASMWSCLICEDKSMQGVPKVWVHKYLFIYIQILLKQMLKLMALDFVTFVYTLNLSFSGLKWTENYYFT